MAMKEEFEKLRYAAELMRTGSHVEREAAREHLDFVVRTSSSVTLRHEAQRILNVAKKVK
jgi:hypothetical protein